MAKKKLSTKDKTVLKMIIDELQTRAVITQTTNTSNNMYDTYTASNANEELYEDIFDKMSQDNDGDTRYDEKTKELSIYFGDKWHRAKIDIITEAIRKKNMTAYEVLEEMLEENGINAN